MQWTLTMFVACLGHSQQKRGQIMSIFKNARCPGNNGVMKEAKLCSVPQISCLVSQERKFSFLLLFWPTHLWKPFLFFTSLAKLSSNSASAFLIPSLHIWPASPKYSQDTHPWFHCPWSLLTLRWRSPAPPASATQRENVVSHEIYFPASINTGPEDRCWRRKEAAAR